MGRACTSALSYHINKVKEISIKREETAGVTAAACPFLWPDASSSNWMSKIPTAPIYCLV